jgi:hypothetical protein
MKNQETLYIFTTSERPDPYINTLVHVFSRFSIAAVRVVAISEHGYSDEREQARATSVVGQIDKQLSELAAGRYVRSASSGGGVAEIDQRGAQIYARCIDQLNKSGISGTVVPLAKLDDYLKQFSARGSGVFDVTALKKHLLVDVVALLLSQGSSEVYSFELIKSPRFNEEDLIHSLREGEFEYRNLTASIPVQRAADRITRRSIRFRTLIGLTLSLGILLVVTQVFFADTWLMTAFGLASIAASIGSYLFPLVRDR